MTSTGCRPDPSRAPSRARRTARYQQELFAHRIIASQIIVGTKSNDIIELTAEHTWRVVNMGHGEGQLWGLALHPSQASPRCPCRP